MIHKIEWNGQVFDYELTRKNVKNLNLRIRSDGTLAVSADRRVSISEIEGFIRRNAAFILRHLEKIERMKQTVPAEDSLLRDGGTFPILGKERVVHVSPGGQNRARLEDDSLIVTVTNPQSKELIRQAIRTLLDELSRTVLPEMCEAIADRFREIALPKLKFRFMVSRWGSCCPSTHTITFNKFLVCVPLNCIEYVAIHEFAHFLVPDHSPAFHRIMTERLPDWKQRKSMLVPYGRLLRGL